MSKGRQIVTLAELDVALAERPKLADRPKPRPSADHRERGRVARRTRKRRRNRMPTAPVVISPAPEACGYCDRPKAPGRHVCAECAARVDETAARFREVHARTGKGVQREDRLG